MGSIPVEVPPRIPIVPVGATARTATGRDIESLSEKSLAIVSDSAS